MSASTKGKKLITAKVITFNPSRQQFKPYAVGLEFSPSLFVELPVSLAYVADSDKDGNVTVTLDGLREIINEYCEMQDAIAAQYLSTTKAKYS